MYNIQWIVYFFIHYTNARLIMAKYEIYKRTVDTWSNFWWTWIADTEVTVKWPTGWVVLHTMPDGSKTSALSADPNDHYRPWLELHVGKQGWDWDWRVGTLDVIDCTTDGLIIKFRKKHKHFKSIVILKWS